MEEGNHDFHKSLSMVLERIVRTNLTDPIMKNVLLRKIILGRSLNREAVRGFTLIASFHCIADLLPQKIGNLAV